MSGQWPKEPILGVQTRPNKFDRATLCGECESFQQVRVGLEQHYVCFFAVLYHVLGPDACVYLADV